MTATQLDLTTLQAELERHTRELDRLRIIVIEERRAHRALFRVLSSILQSSPPPRRRLGRLS